MPIFGTSVSTSDANVWTAQQVFETGAAGASPVCFRQTGGVAGTDEVQVSHNGTDGLVDSKDGKLRLAAQGTVRLEINSSNVIVTDVLPDGSLTRAIGSSPLSFQSIFGRDFYSENTAGFYRVGGDTSLRRAAAGVWLLAGSTAAARSTLSSLPLPAAQITADTNNYAPGVAMFYRLSTDASRNITGLSVSQVDGQMAEVWNVGSNAIVLKHQDAGSTAANRFLCTGGADITLAADEVALLRYDGTTGRWRVRKV